MQNRIPATLLVLIATGLVGCSPNYTQPIVLEEPMTPAQRNFETVWQAAIELLGEYSFSADPLRGGLQDRRAGVIRSAPMIGQQWFEFWRKDAASPTDLTESSLQTIYRQVTIRIKPASADSTQFVALVEAQTFRSDKAVRWQGHSYWQIYSMFQMPGQTQGQHHLILKEPAEDPKAVIVPLGRDKDLEAKIAMDLAKATANRQTAGAE
jgi:hypothetical protein